MNLLTDEEFKDNKPGYIFVPYIMHTRSTSINGVTVWHHNKFINLLIKIKLFFYKPKALKDFGKHSKKTVNKDYYGVLDIKNIKISRDKRCLLCK